ncbi:endonuclease III [Candidatus Pacearchaeota archaeon CG10_big_fil_rev_8_21_14_0_10_31_9]|nr:MAG: endonuclease III [Candidatus Pacearchaeota archaeon CG10_big_fil_rev_8_21_14_0_10_31_9]PIZ83869.1 MAG: endonuclease III [Candidatus Pacearchaeota archaeon CG_4_10_14_0_2_um_filter_05_32_18]
MDQKKAIRQLSQIKKLDGSMRLAGEGWQSEFQTLIAIILSARSLDETTIKYATILFKKYPSAIELSKANKADVEKIIRPINFYRNKSRNIIECANQIVKEYKGEVPMKFEDLIKLKGVGRKTANVFLSEYGHDAIGVDTHLSYISNYLGWTKTKKPEIIEKDLEKLFPKKYWSRLNQNVVKFGKKYTSKKEKNKLLDEIKNIK